MARTRHSRSPSPTGNNTARRHRGHGRRFSRSRSRDRRDDRSYRPRDKSRSPVRRHNDRDDRGPRRHSPRGRHSHDADPRNARSEYRPPDRPRSRDRRRSRERSPVRGHKDAVRRGGDGYYRDRRDDSRDRNRHRRDTSTDAKRKAWRDDSRERSRKSTPNRSVNETPKDSPSTKQSEEERKKAERHARLEAWKAKQLAEREKKQKATVSGGGARSILDEMDKKAASISSPTTASPREDVVESKGASPAPYAGAFDPKKIAKKATSQVAQSAALGGDVAVPTTSQSVSTISWTKPQNGSKPTSSSLKASGNVSGFGLAIKVNTEPERPANKRALELGEEESTRKKLERLPTPPPGDVSLSYDATEAATAEAEDEDEEMVDGGSEEEAAAAARVAAEKREERLQNEMKTELSANGDTKMTESSNTAADEVTAVDVEVDPLDAFMSGLGDITEPGKPVSKQDLQSKKGRQQEPKAMFNDDGDDFDAIDETPEDILAVSGKKKKREMPTVVHSEMNYLPFRKNFYAEPAEYADMTEGQLKDLRHRLDGINVTGQNVPKPVQTWGQCGLGFQIVDVIRKLGYESPTSIQAQALPAVMSGRDVIGVAKTGSGKTVSFLLPMFRHIKDQPPLATLDGPIALIIAPTRELATQIHKECRPYAKAVGLRAVCAYGGAPIKDQIAELKRGTEILVCTAGRLVDLLAANSGRVTNLRRVTYVVLDEADRMFDMGFEPQITKIMSSIRPDRQTVLFSATFPRPMESLARKVLTKPVGVFVGGRSVVAPEIKQIVEVRPENTKFNQLLYLLGQLHDNDEDARSLVFVERQESADNLLKELMRKGYPCMSIHGGKDQIDRDSAIEDFKNGVVPVLIATSVAARGLDVKQLKLVVNYDAPNHLEDYVHRAGRTGRAGNTGTAVTFLTEEQDRYAVDIAKALKESKQEIPEALQKMADGFLEKVKAGKERASGSGFGGKGLDRLDQERDAARQRERGAYKTGDEPDEEEKKAEKPEDIVVKARDAPAAAPIAPKASTTASKMPDTLDLDAKIIVHKREIPEPTAGTITVDKMDRARAARDSINKRLGTHNEMRPGQPIDNRGPDAGAYHATLEINDFAQKARWAVTNRTNVARILEATGTSITTKGNYYGTGKEPGPNDLPKLYILVEGDTELVVTQAMLELKRLLREGQEAQADRDARAPASGRYSVI